MFPDGVNPILAQVQADKDAARQQVEDELWARRFGPADADQLTVVYHPFNDSTPEED